MAERERTAVAPRREEIRSSVENIESLATLSTITAALSEILDDSESSAKDIADLISRDHALSANLLKLVNSPFYGFPGRIASIRHAVILLGSNVVRAVSSNTVVHRVSGKALKGLWTHSLGVALASRLVAAELGVGEPEELMIAGLLHDVGKAVLHTLLKEEAERVSQFAAQHNMFIFEAERELFGVDHAEVGGWVAERWNFPVTLKEPISYHHEPDSSKETALRTAIVHFANILVHGLDFGDDSENLVPPLDEMAWNRLGFLAEKLREIVNQVDGELSATETALFGST